MTRAVLKNFREAPRKVRLVADTIRGEKADVALNNLSFVPKKAAQPIKKLLASAVANATNNDGLDADKLYVKSIQVNEGYTLKRWIPKWRGMANPIRKRTSHIVIELEEKGVTGKKKAPKKAQAKKDAPSKRQTKVVEDKPDFGSSEDFSKSTGRHGSNDQIIHRTTSK
jgi:large subunit ribosomal protein L22